MAPTPFTVSRSASINAPASVVFGFINDFHQWRQWSPYEDIDPSLDRTYSGAEQGEGAHYAWRGNAKAGSGNMTITESTPSSLIAIDLNFTKPFTAHNKVEFTLTESAGVTHITWAMHGEHRGITKLFAKVMNMDKVLGGQYDQGLAALKKCSENAS